MDHGIPQVDDASSPQAASYRTVEEVGSDSKTTTNIAGPMPEDLGAVVASRAARGVVFVLLCQGVQMFMSYDGGAVPASLDTLQGIFIKDPWSEFEFGLLGAMDKVGMVAASVPWGWALQRYNAKLLLTASLLLNALITFAFGWLPSKGLMLAAKFLMGATQSLQGVWGTVWTLTMAPPDRRTMWLGLGAVSAGIGNGIGTCVAGFGTANGLPFAFAFQLAGGVLGFIWILQLLIPASWLRTTVLQSGAEQSSKRVDSAPGRPQTSSASDALALPTSQDRPLLAAQFQILAWNRLYVGTTLAISLCMFEVSGIQFLWTRVFTQVWMVAPGQELSKNWVTAMFLVVTGGGGGLGIAFGPWFIDKRGGFNNLPGVLRSLRILWGYQLIAAAAGAVGAATLYGKLHPWSYSGEWGDVWLWLCWACIFIIYAAQNACVAALCGINLQVVPQNVRTFASGTEITIRNMLGYIGGPLFPSIMMTLNSGWRHGGVWQLSLGIGFVLLANILGVAILGRLRLAAQLELSQQRVDALKHLREALQSEDLQKLSQAVVLARHVELEKWKHGDGASVLGMANELIGRCYERGPGAHQVSSAAETYTELQDQMVSLQQEVQNYREELAQQQDEIRILRSLGVVLPL